MRKPYVRPMPGDWFMRRAGYRRFMIRELTAIPIVIYLVFLVVLFLRVGEGARAFAELAESLNSPAMLGFHVVVLVAALYHSITWFNSVSKGISVQIGEKKAPDAAVAFGMGYLPWILVTAFVLWFVLA